MKQAPRASRPPKMVVRCWAASVLLGTVVLATSASAEPDNGGLTPRTLPSYLAAAAPPGATAIRVNGVYGSGGRGAWQFVAHLTWRTRDGDVTGGIVYLPEGVGAPAGSTPFPPERLAVEEHLGWSLSELGSATRAWTHADAGLAMLELAIPTSADGQLTLCSASAPGSASCTVRSRHGRTSTSRSQLDVTPELGPLSVQRTESVSRSR
jgi:hypothetical protein